MNLKSKFLRTLLITLLVLLPLAYKFRQATAGQLIVDRVEAVGDLIITYLGVPLGDPVFDVHNFLPGDCETRTIDVENDGLNAVKVSVWSDNEIDNDNLSTQLDFVIREGGFDLYGGTATSGAKLVSDFFADSDLPGHVMLSVVGPGDSTSYDFEVCFNEDAGNQYQNTEVIFDLKFQDLVVIDLPPECDALEGIVTAQITGTPGNDDLDGGPANEYIVGLAGNDKIDGGGGDDCIVGNEGVDKIDSGSGNDIVVGSQDSDKIDTGSGNDIVWGLDGNDHIDSGSGNDIIYGGEGNDDLDGHAGDDLIYGEAGNDKIRGGDGADEIYGGTGNDNIRGGSEIDYIYGEAGNDDIRGGSGNDYLDGGPDIDDLDGNSGTDTCVFGENLSSCEI